MQVCCCALTHLYENFIGVSLPSRAFLKILVTFFALLLQVGGYRMVQRGKKSDGGLGVWGVNNTGHGTEWNGLGVFLIGGAGFHRRNGGPLYF